MLAVPGSKVRCLRENKIHLPVPVTLNIRGFMYCGILRVEYPQYFEIMCCGDCYAGSISGFNTVEHCCTSSISGFSTAGFAKYRQYFVRWFCQYCEFSEYQNTLNKRSILLRVRAGPAEVLIGWLIGDTPLNTTCWDVTFWHRVDYAPTNKRKT